MQLAQLYASGQHELTVTVPRAAQQDNGHKTEFLCKKKIYIYIYI